MTYWFNNITSVSANLESLEIFVAQSKHFVIALTETWWKNESDADLFCLLGYQRPFASTRNRKRGGGVAIYVTPDLEAELLHTDEAHESISVKISDFKKKEKNSFLLFL